MFNLSWVKIKKPRAVALLHGASQENPPFGVQEFSKKSRRAKTWRIFTPIADNHQTIKEFALAGMQNYAEIRLFDLIVNLSKDFYLFLRNPSRNFLTTMKYKSTPIHIGKSRKVMPIRIPVRTPIMMDSIWVPDIVITQWKGKERDARSGKMKVQGKRWKTIRI